MKLTPKKKKKKSNAVKIIALSIPIGLISYDVAAQTLPIAISVSQNLHFGTFYTNGASGDVIISTAGARTVAGGAVGVAGSGLEGRGEISITASTGVVVTIALTASSFNLLNADSDILVVNDFHLDTPTGGNSITKLITASPSIIPIGGTLNVPLNAPSGTYIGTYGLNVVYQ
jgi:hypothetical protein